MWLLFTRYCSDPFRRRDSGSHERNPTTDCRHEDFVIKLVQVDMGLSGQMLDITVDCYVLVCSHSANDTKLIVP